MWNPLNQAWRTRTGGVPFHAADCESGYGDYRLVDPVERTQLPLDLAQILAKSGIIGYGIGIDLVGCRRAFPDMLADHTYYSAFLRTVDFLVARARAMNSNEPVKIVLDRHQRTEHNTGLLYKYASEDGRWQDESVLSDRLSFASRDEIGIQVADLWVREFMKYFDGHLFSDQYVARPQCQVLLDTGRFGGDLQCAEYFDDMKVKMPILEAQTGMGRERYISWLKRKRRQDNQSNRIVYMMEVAAEDRKANRR